MRSPRCWGSRSPRAPPSGRLGASSGPAAMPDRILGPPPTTGTIDYESTYCYCEYMLRAKDERLQIRLQPELKQLLQEAAQAARLTLSALVSQAAQARAEEILADRQSISLSPEQAVAFTEALSRPAAVNERLAQALARPPAFTWVE